MKNTFLKIGLAVALTLAFFAPHAEAAAGHSSIYTNIVASGQVSYSTNHGATFKMMFPGVNESRIEVKEFSWMPTNVFASTFALYTGDTVSGTTVSVAGASGDTALVFGGTAASTNGFTVPLKCVLQIPTSNRLIMLTVSNCLAGSNYVAFNETLGFAIPVGSKIYQMNRSNVWINQTTNEIERINAFAGRLNYPLLLEVSDGGAARLNLNYTP